jgi:hypothetical protein
MVNGLVDAWGRSARPAPEWAASLEALALQHLAAPAVAPHRVAFADFGALRDAACTDLLRRFACPVRVAEVGETLLVSVLDAAVYVHQRQQRQVNVGTWQVDGSVAIHAAARFEIGRPLGTFGWLDILFAQWNATWPRFSPLLERRAIRNRLHNALVRWMRQTVDLKAQRIVFREALALDERVVWMAGQLERPRRRAWLFADHYNAVGAQLQRLEWALKDSASLFRLVGLALIEKRLQDPDAPVASTQRALRRACGISDAGWRLACHAGPRLFDAIMNRAASNRLFDACVEMLRLVEQTNLAVPPRALLHALFLQYALPGSDKVLFRVAWCDLPAWFLRNAVRAARDCLTARELEDFIDGEFLPAIEWATEVQPRPDANQIRAGWSWIVRACHTWFNDPAAQWAGSEVRWPCPVGMVPIEGYNAFALASAVDMVEEGRVMAHCIARYIEHCMRGEARVFSLRDAFTGERAATAMIRRVAEGEWELVDVRGRRNAVGPPAARRAGECLAQIYGETGEGGLRAA